MNEDTGPADPFLCLGSGKQALQDEKPGLDRPWLGVCPAVVWLDGDPFPCPGSGKQALHEETPGLDGPWFGLCPICRTRLELGFAGIVPVHDAPGPEDTIDATLEPETRP